MTVAALVSIEDNLLKNEMNSDIENISGIQALNSYYHKMQNYYNKDDEQLMRFYCIGFLVSYENQGKLKNTLFKSNYSYLKKCSPEIRNILYDNIKSQNIKFLNYCLSIEMVPFFLKDQPEISKLFNDMVFKSFRQQMPRQLVNCLSIIKFLSSHNNMEVDINYLNEKLSKNYHFKYWQVLKNPYINYDLIYNLKINNKKIKTSLLNAIVWQWFDSGASLLLTGKNKVPITGYDQNKYENLLDFIKSFSANQFIKDNLYQYFDSKINKAKVNKEQWQVCSLSFYLPNKENKEKIVKI